MAGSLYLGVWASRCRRNAFLMLRISGEHGWSSGSLQHIKCNFPKFTKYGITTYGASQVACPHVTPQADLEEPQIQLPPFFFHLQNSAGSGRGRQRRHRELGRAPLCPSVRMCWTLQAELPDHRQRVAGKSLCPLGGRLLCQVGL